MIFELLAEVEDKLCAILACLLQLVLNAGRQEGDPVAKTTDAELNLAVCEKKRIHLLPVVDCLVAVYREIARLVKDLASRQGFSVLGAELADLPDQLLKANVLVHMQPHIEGKYLSRWSLCCRSWRTFGW